MVNIVAKGEIARFVQFLLLFLCFQKGIRKRVYEGKELKWSVPSKDNEKLENDMEECIPPGPMVTG